MDKTPQRVVLLLAIVSVAIYLWVRSTRNQQGSAPRSAPPAVSSARPKPAPSEPLSSLTENLRAMPQALRSAQTGGGAAPQLAALRQALATASTNEAVSTIESFLDSKADGATGQGFKIGG